MDYAHTVLLEEAQDAMLKTISFAKKTKITSKQDDLAMALVPSNPPLDLYTAMQTTGNGNCLFNAASLVLKGMLME